MDRTVTKGILSAVVSLAATAILATPAGAWSGKHKACLAPSGTGDDTAPLQSALEKCSGAKKGCVVSLCEGTFRIAPVRVKDFRGVLRGAGRGRTVIQALPNLDVNDNPDGYFMNDPFDPTFGPWPVLLQFIEGKAKIRDLTVEIPSPAPEETPTLGWLGGLVFELDGAILITGKDPVDFGVERVRVIAGEYPDGFFGTTLLNGISFEGRLFNPADLGTYPVFPLRGRFRLSDSELVGMLSGSGVAELRHAKVTIAHNRYRSGFAMFVQDADRSHVRILDNRWETKFSGLQVFLNVDGEFSERNSFLVHGNSGTTEVAFPEFLGFGVGHGIVFVDPWDFETREPGGSVIGLAGNDLSVSTVLGPALSGIDVTGAGRLWAWRNVVRGEASLGGINVDLTSGCWLVRNVLETTGGPDLALGPDTQRCLAVVSHDDVVADQGTDNWILRR
jgi:hypothetical protein